MQNSSKFNDTYFVLLEAHCNMNRIPINDLCETIYDCDYIFEKEFGTFLSEKAKEKHQQAFVGNGKTKPSCKRAEKGNAREDWCQRKNNTYEMDKRKTLNKR